MNNRREEDGGGIFITENKYPFIFLFGKMGILELWSGTGKQLEPEYDLNSSFLKTSSSSAGGKDPLPLFFNKGPKSFSNLF